MTLHVAVDAHNLTRDDRGIGRYARTILRRALDVPDVRFTLVVRDWFPRRRAIARLLGRDDARVAKRIPRDADVVWFPWNGTFLTTALPTVASVFDVVPFRFPAADPKLRTREQTPFLRTARTARRIIVPSRSTALEIERYLGVPPERLALVPLGVDPAFTPSGDAFRLPDGRPYLLHVGAHDAHKNTAVLIAAWRRAFAPGEAALIFTRRPPQLPDGALVQAPPGDTELAALYRGAALAVVPSTYEGFGLPALEALACGTRLVASRAASLPEVGGDACRYVEDPTDVESWAAALRAAFDDDAFRAQAAVAGPLRAKAFSWETCVARTLEVFREAAG